MNAHAELVGELAELFWAEGLVKFHRIRTPRHEGQNTMFAFCSPLIGSEDGSEFTPCLLNSARSRGQKHAQMQQ
jgi:hypothetical protein